VRTWHQPEAPAEGAYGSDVVVDSQGRAIVAGASKQGGVLRGQAFARTIGKVEQWPLWAHLFPFSKESSEALGAARDEYDRIFIGGYVTAGGSPQTWLVKAKPVSAAGPLQARAPVKRTREVAARLDIAPRVS